MRTGFAGEGPGRGIAGAPPPGRVERRVLAVAHWSIGPRAIRQAAVLALVAGCLGLANDLVSGRLGALGHAPFDLDALTLLIGVLLWRAQAWRWGWSAVALPLLALAIIALNDTLGAESAELVGAWLLLVSVWVGLWFPRGTALALAPLSTAAYVLPLLYGAPRTRSDLESAVLVIPLVVLAGELVAETSATLRRSHREQQHLLGELGRQTVTDPLTGVGNRRLGDMLLSSLVPEDAVVVVDVDVFKALNDRCGHLAGDDVLRTLGTYLRSCIRDQDGVARLGGDEFVMVLRGVGGSAPSIAARICQGWRECCLAVTLSAGVAVHRRGRTATETYAAADAALYQAKVAGRDRVEAEPRAPENAGRPDR